MENLVLISLLESVLGKSKPTSSVTTLNRPEPKLIGMYDMLGRPVYFIRQDEILIYLYSDGHSEKKVVR
jgi:hypothetical protein